MHPDFCYGKLIAAIPVSKGKSTRLKTIQSTHCDYGQVQELIAEFKANNAPLVQMVEFIFQPDPKYV